MTMRSLLGRRLIGLLLACAALSVAAAACKKPVECAQSACTHTLMTVHLPLSMSEARAAITRICKNDACGEVGGNDPAVMADPNVPGGIREEFRGGLLTGVEFSEDGVGWTRLRVPSIAFHYRKDQTVHPYTDGDLLSVRVTRPDGAVPMDVSRRIKYTLADADRRCIPDGCPSAAIDLYPASKSETCSADMCESSVELRAALEVTYQLAAYSRIVVCMNSRCGETRLIDRVWTGDLRGDFRTDTRDGLELTFLPSVNAALLADGDRFSISMTDIHGHDLLRFSEIAKYEASLPNGPACDPYPCRKVRFDVPYVGPDERGGEK